MKLTKYIVKAVVYGLALALTVDGVNYNMKLAGEELRRMTRRA